MSTFSTVIIFILFFKFTISFRLDFYISKFRFFETINCIREVLIMAALHAHRVTEMKNAGDSWSCSNLMNKQEFGLGEEQRLIIQALHF